MSRKHKFLLISVFISLTLVGMFTTSFGVWVALHLKQFPSYPVWMAVALSFIITLKTGQLLSEMIGEEIDE